MLIPTGPAIGLIELCSVARGLQVCDAMVKRAAVQIVRSTTTHPGKYMILIRGGVDEVHEALQAGRALAREALIDLLELPNPHEQLNTVLDQVQHPQIQSIGIFECYSIASTIRGADAALKAAEISACKIQLADGLGGKGYFLFSGELFDVEAAMEFAIKAIGDGLLAAQEIIPRPHPDFVDVLTSTGR